MGAEATGSIRPFRLTSLERPSNAMMFVFGPRSVHLGFDIHLRSKTEGEYRSEPSQEGSPSVHLQDVLT